jgi:cellulose synthase operon protein C
MTVRWKPLLILSGLFVIVALVGLMGLATVMGSGGIDKILARARTEVKAKEYEKAKLDYQRALRLDSRDASVHEEMANLYDEWSRVAPPEKRAELRGLYLASLTSATKNNGSKRVEPRKRMLAEAFRQDDASEQVRWSKELATLDPTNRDAHYVLAATDLESPSPNIPEVRRHLKALEAETPRRARTDWIAAQVVSLENDRPGLEEIFKKTRGITLPIDADPIDRMALLRLDALDVVNSTDPAILSGSIEAVAREALAASAEPDIPSTRISRISLLIEEVQRTLVRKGQDSPSEQDRYKGYAEKLDQVADTIFQKSLEVKGGADLNVYLAYADHLRFRDHRDRAMVIALQGLKSPAGARLSGSEVAMGLHALAVESSLSNMVDEDRYETAGPHIKALLECKFARFQALGHLFQGAIDLEKAGMVADAQRPGDISKADQAKLRASALEHLKKAAAQLPHMAEAQARYGVALILNQEPAMGRQYLQLAQRLGNLEAQYQIWTAWSVVQAGYPEDAEPIVARMIEDVRLGRLPKAMEGTLHLLNGEIHQARKSPTDLKKAVAEYRQAFGEGQDATPAVELRLAQIEVMLGRPADALKRIDWLVSKEKAGPAAENLAVLTLQELKRDDEARNRLDAARAKFPENAELAVLDASTLAKAKRFEDADRILAGFLAKYPDSVPAVQMRAQILARDLDRPGEARKLLSDVAERSDNSAPLVQLALLEMGAKDYDAMSASIAKVRSRWKDAATGDLLDAQLALNKKDRTAASGFFDAALKKDPNNKIVQFWKAQLDGQADPEGASKVFESLAQGDSVKELEDGVTLAAASQSALAFLATEGGDLDQAIARYREMLKDPSNAGHARVIRWQIIGAQAAKKEWPAAKAELNSLLKDPKSPPTAEELVRAATFFRLNKEDDTALKLSDEVLKADPTYSGAVVTRAEILARTGKHADAIATINQSIEASKKAGKPSPSVLYLMKAAVESTTPPLDQNQGFRRALVVLDQGLGLDPGAMELVQAKCKVLTILEGPKAGAAFVEERAKADPKGPCRRMLMKVYADQSDLASAERVAADLVKETPTDSEAAATQVRMLAGQSREASNRGDRKEAKRIDDKAAALIYDYRSRFKTDSTFTQLDCELELRRGDTTRALALTQELDSRSKSSPVGPLLRAQIFASKGQSREAAAAYAEALSRNPRLPEARLQLARLSLRNGQTDEALRQAKYLLDADPDKPTGMAALLVEARATASQPGTAAQVQTNRAKAVEKLAGAIKDRPDFADAYHLTADIHMLGSDRVKAIAVLKDALKANPDDTLALRMAVQILADRKGKTASFAKADLDQAIALAKASADLDPKGARMLAASNGFSSANQTDQAIPWAEKAAAKLDSAAARLNLGDLLLTQSESQSDLEKARQLQDRALTEYDAVLAAQPNVIEAVNNKAWILHRYRGESLKALELAQGLLQRVDPNALPGEFYDTLGSIQEDLKRPKDAEESYKKGLGKLPEHPVLNFHMGSLMAADPSRARKAADYLKVARAGSERLPADMAGRLASLLKQFGE